MLDALQRALNRRLGTDVLETMIAPGNQSPQMPVPSAKPAPLKTADELVSTDLQTVYQTWLTLAGDRPAPKRTDLTPQHFRKHLANVFIIDVLDGGMDFHFRLGGENIVRFMGRRYAGSRLSQLRGAPFFEAMHRIFAHCTVARAPVAAGPARPTREGREQMEMEVVVLPLSDDGRNITALFGAFDLKPLQADRYAEPAPGATLSATDYQL